MFNCLFFAPVQVMKVLSWTQIAGQYIPLVQFSPFMANGQVYHNVNVAFYSIMYMSAFSSILTFFAIAVERCKAIFNPMQHLQTVYAWRIFGAIWLISFCIPLPYLFFLFRIVAHWLAASCAIKIAFENYLGNFYWISFPKQCTWGFLFVF